MNDFEIIDVHAHLGVTREDELEQFGHRPGLRERDYWATPERAISHMDNIGISKMCYLILIPFMSLPAIAEKAKLLELPTEQRQKEAERIGELIAPVIRKHNELGCEVGRRFPRILPFILMSNDLGKPEALVEEVVLRVSQGAKGVKLHPAMLAYFPDDESLWPMYEKCQELGLPVVADSMPRLAASVWTIHPWRFQMPPEFIPYGEPKNFVRVLEAFPRLTLILAHLGSGWWDERVELAQKYPKVYFDTSLGFVAPDQIPFCPHRGLAEDDAVRIIRKIGVDRIMFGTDFPAQSSQLQLQQILRLRLSDEEKKMILADNAKRILRI